MGFTTIKEWSNCGKRGHRVMNERGRSWTRRIQWMEDEQGRVKLKMEVDDIYREVIPQASLAQTIWDRFKAGQTIDECVSILALDAPTHLQSKKASKSEVSDGC